jgi:RNA polymerase sigma-70 factor (ECF subfamily)
MLVAAVSETAVSEPSGLEKAFREHHIRVFRAAWRITGNAPDAEDILQTVFLRLAQKGDLAAENASSYLYRAAVNASIDLLRGRRGGATLEEADRSLRSVDTPERARESGEIREWLRQALATLPAQAAEMFALRFLEGHGNKEIARMLGVSRMRVGVVLHRTRHRLQQELRQRGSKP